jgi:hypothetical protein
MDFSRGCGSGRCVIARHPMPRKSRRCLVALLGRLLEAHLISGDHKDGTDWTLRRYTDEQFIGGLFKDGYLNFVVFNKIGWTKEADLSGSFRGDGHSELVGEEPSLCFANQ